ncbi:hypothetical protein OESDEN_19489, partial [Oesophagostomum dentatum]
LVSIRVFSEHPPPSRALKDNFSIKISYNFSDLQVSVTTDSLIDPELYLVTILNALCYRAMFVENCRVEQESLKIEKTGKERRRERQKLKKMGVDPDEQPTAPDDIFLPVRCAVCSTNVAVMDHDEVYHFFNVLSGYA